MNSQARRVVESEFRSVDVKLDGVRPWDVTINDNRIFTRIVFDGSKGLAESYTEGWWDCEQLDELIVRLMRLRSTKLLLGRLRNNLSGIAATIFDAQKGVGSKAVASIHYDLEPALFEAMLGPTMNYSCAYWRNAEDLSEAQTAKMDLICRKLALGEGMRLLDIGCGWGGFAEFAAKHYSCEVVGVTVSSKQAEYARIRCEKLPVEIRCLDYRELPEDEEASFDAVSSIGMLEHVGRKNYGRLFEKVSKLLKRSGLALIQTIGRERCAPTDRWVNKYIFPNSYIPSAAELANGAKNHLIIEDWHNFGADYDRTLMQWAANFEDWANHNWKLSDRKRYRTWKFYLLSFAAAFRIRTGFQLWQVTMSPGGVQGGYPSLR